MPHIDVQYTGDLAMAFDRSGFAAEVVPLAERAVGANPAACKVKFLRIEEAVIADGAGTNSLVHVQVSLFRGRTAEAKAALRSGLLELLRRFITAPAQVSVETRDFDRDEYAKETL